MPLTSRFSMLTMFLLALIGSSGMLAGAFFWVCRIAAVIAGNVKVVDESGDWIVGFLLHSILQICHDFARQNLSHVTTIAETPSATMFWVWLCMFSLGFLTVAIIDFPGEMNYLDRTGFSISHSTIYLDLFENSSCCLRQIFGDLLIVQFQGQPP